MTTIQADTLLRGHRRRPVFGEAQVPTLLGVPAPVDEHLGVRV